MTRGGKVLLAVVMLSLCAGNVGANKPGVPYDEQPKYQRMLCILAGIPMKYCRRKEK
jgi:hypothetical protein